MSATQASLASVQAKIRRAQQHHAELTEAIRSWTTNAVFELQGGLDADGIYRLRFATAPQPPSDLALPLADMLVNLRAALDYLVWQLVLANGGSPTQSNMFPVVRKDSEWHREAKRRLAGVAERWVDVIDGLQPFRHHPEAPDHHWLGFLDRANNVNKHRLMAPVTLSQFVGMPSLHFSRTGQPRDVQLIGPKSPQIQEGALFLGIKVEPVDPGLRVTVEQDWVQVGISFNHGIDAPGPFPDLIGHAEAAITNFEAAFLS
jgi:hypothetical protein